MYQAALGFLTSDICLTLCKQKNKRKIKFVVITSNSFGTIIEYTL